MIPQKGPEPIALLPPSPLVACTQLPVTETGVQAVTGPAQALRLYADSCCPPPPGKVTLNDWKPPSGAHELSNTLRLPAGTVQPVSEKRSTMTALLTVATVRTVRRVMTLDLNCILS